MRPSSLVRRGGFTLIEVVATTVMLGALMSMTVPLLHAVNAQRRHAAARQFAVQETANMMERFSARDWNDITPATAAKVELSETGKAMLRDASLTITVAPISAQPTSKRVHIELRWKNREGDFVVPVKLTTFVYRHKELK